MLGDPRHNVVFVGLPAQGRPGRAIPATRAAGAVMLREGERYSIKAGVHTLGGYSAPCGVQKRVSRVPFTGVRHGPEEVRLCTVTT